jgi:hypothetical protein
MCPNTAIDLDVFLQHAFCLGEHEALQLVQRQVSMLLHIRPHTFDGPEQVHRRWTGLGQRRAHLRQRRVEVCSAVELLHPQDNTPSSGYPNSWSATHHHRGNRPGDLLVGATIDILFHQRQLTLIEEPHTIWGNLYGLNDGFHIGVDFCLCNTKHHRDLSSGQTGDTKKLVPTLLASVELHLRTTDTECFCQQGDTRSIGSALKRGCRDAQP